MKKYILILLSLLGFKLLAQENLQGRLLTKDGSETIPLIGANVFWLNTEIGTITDEEGKFLGICAALQTFPNDFKFLYSNLNDGYKMIGNGWTVAVISHIMKNMEK